MKDPERARAHTHTVWGWRGERDSEKEKSEREIDVDVNRGRDNGERKGGRWRSREKLRKSSRDRLHSRGPGLQPLSRLIK